MQLLEKAIALNPEHPGANKELVRLKSSPQASENWFDYTVASELVANGSNQSSSGVYNQPFIIAGAGVLLLLVALIVIVLVANNGTKPNNAANLSNIGQVASQNASAATATPSEIVVLVPTPTPLPLPIYGPTAIAPSPASYPTNPNPVQAAASPTPSNGRVADGPVVPFSFNIIDAQYDAATNKLIIISDNPSQLHIFDPTTQKDITVALERPPHSLSVGPDGKFAAVGHDALISYVDLQQAKVVKTLDLTADAFSIVLAGNGWIYVCPKSDQWQSLHAVEIATNKEVTSTGNPVWSGSIYKLSPDGKYLYGADRGLSPSSLIKFDITNGTPVESNRFPYHGDYEVCGNLWFSADDRRIFTACDNLFKLSSDASLDMTYNGKLDALAGIFNLYHSQAAGKILVIPEDSNFQAGSVNTLNKIIIFDYTTLNRNEIITMPDFSESGQSYQAHARYVFANSAGNKYYVIVKADDKSGLLNDFGLVSSDFPTQSTNTQPTGNTATPYPNTTTSTVPASANTTPNTNSANNKINVLNYTVVDANYSTSLDRLVMLSDNPPLLHIYDPNTTKDQTIALTKPPHFLAVSPDGKSAVVASDALVAYIDLVQGKLVKNYDVSLNPSSILLTDDGWAYMTGGSFDAPLHELDLKSGKENKNPSGAIDGGTVFRLTPDGKSMYGLNSSGSPQFMYKVNISGGTPSFSARSPYWGDYPLGSKLWISPDGKRIFSATGNVFKASSDKNLDMTYNGQLENLSSSNYLSSVYALACSPTKNLILATRSFGGPATTDPVNAGNKIFFFDYGNLSQIKQETLPDFTNGGSSYAADGNFIFINSTGTKYYSIVQADPKSGLLNDFGVVVNDLK